jgi:putative N6-adenine-specific DNA methylase
MSSFRVFAQCTPGVEALLLKELSEIGVARRAKIEPGGVTLWATERELWTLVTQSLLADAVRVGVGKPYRAISFEQLFKGMTRVAPSLRAFVRDPAIVTLRARTRWSRLWHSDAIAERVVKALNLPESAGTRPPDEARDVAMSVRLVRDVVELSVEAAAELHVRGCKPHAVDNQLRETIAAACVYAALEGAPPDAPLTLWDPFCGSGTFLLEAALLHARRAAGSALLASRAPTVERLPLARFASKTPGAFGAVVRESAPRAAALTAAAARLSLFGSDVNPRAVEAAEHNVRFGLGAQLAPRAVVLGALDFERAAALVPARATVLSNVPWVVRSTGETETQVYRRLGAVLHARALGGARVFVLSGNQRFRSMSGVQWQQLLSFRVGGAPAHLLQLLPR